MKYLFLLPLLFLFCSPSSAQDSTETKHPEFYLYYGFTGFGSNRFLSYPAIRVYDSVFVCTKESGWTYPDRPGYSDTLLTGAFRQSSLDSINDILSSYHDTTVREINLCLTSGGLYLLKAVKGTDTVLFSMKNTFHCKAFEVAAILDTYIPEAYRLHPTEALITKQKECWEYMTSGDY